ncbi:MAG: UDP-3-O-(3-hydroxymyristoyl)glucosamine N-acyltransferase [Campylobacterales bacterium]|nr:UDP-3-O-(3-hydroxymyristoyl)glucosamine N-acyltransferase [Campylobacterales bacterium]
MLLSKIAKELGLSFDGEDIEITGIHTLSEAGSVQISFFDNARYKDQLSQTRAAAVLCEERYALLLPKETRVLITDEPYLKLALASKLFAYNISTKTSTPSLGKNCDIDKSVVFGRNVVIGDDVIILANCYIGDDVTIKAGTLLHANVSIYHHCEVGQNCILHSGAVIGSDGFGFAHTKDGRHVKIYQNGNVIIGDDVEIGANCAIDRAVFGTTYIREGVKMDNLIQIGHNCDIGAYSLFAGQAGIAGSTKVGRNAVFGGQSATSGHLNIGDFVQVAGKSGVTKSLEGGKTYAGFPAVEHKEWLKNQAKLSSLLKKFKS